jgi:hypothetical protein
VPPRQSRQALGRSPSSYAELDTMMEHIIPNLGHFPRSDASVAFALNELDTLLGDEVRCAVWCCRVSISYCFIHERRAVWACRRRIRSRGALVGGRFRVRRRI